MKSSSAVPKPSDCPRCATPLVTIEREGVRVEVCSNGCRGLRIECGVLDRLAQAEVEAPVVERFSGIAVSELVCTGCKTRMRASRVESVVVDRCSACSTLDLADAERRRLHEPRWAWDFFDPLGILFALLSW